jgi:protein-arginine kinase activator protein McsA
LEHKNVHWGLKYACAYCYIKFEDFKSFEEAGHACIFCREKFSGLEPAVDHVVNCIRNNEDTRAKLIDHTTWWARRSRFLWKRNGPGCFPGHAHLLEHLEEMHAGVPSELRTEAYTETWTVEFQQAEKTCKNCDRTFSSCQGLDEHYYTFHFEGKSRLHH